MKQRLGLLMTWGLICQLMLAIPTAWCGNIALQIVGSTSPDDILSWADDPSFNAPEAAKPMQVVSDQSVFLAFLVSGFTLNAGGDYDVVVHWSLKSPDGKTVLAKRDYAAAKGWAQSGGSLVMADPALKLTLESGDPPGIYRLTAEAVDRIGRTSVRAVYVFTLIF